MAGTKKTPVAPKETKKGKKDKGEGGGPKKAEITVILNDKEASKIIQNSKVVTVHDLARQTGVKISAANVYLKEALKKGAIRKVGGYSGHYIYQPVTS